MFKADFDAIVLALQNVGLTIIEDLGKGLYRFNYFPLTGAGYILQTALASALQDDATKALVALGLGGSYCIPTELFVRVVVEYDYGSFVLNFFVVERVLKISFVDGTLEGIDRESGTST